MNRNRSLGSLRATLLVFIIVVAASGARAATKYKVLYNFKGGSDGIGPNGLILDPAGNLYGTTDVGGGGGCTNEGCGTAFHLAKSNGKWSEKVLVRFKDIGGDHADSGVIMDAMGNLYGTASDDALTESGLVFKLTPGEKGKWSASVLHAFTGGDDGGYPFGGLVRDKHGNLYGVTDEGGGYYGSCGTRGCGTVFELIPPRTKVGEWRKKVLYRFKGGSDGGNPDAAMIFDSLGNLYGTTSIGGVYGGGTVFRLELDSHGKWTEHVIHSFNEKTDGAGPFGSVIFDGQGNLYCTTYAGASSTRGSVVELIPHAHEWQEKIIHVFKGGSDGGNPYSGLVMDASGALYGTTSDALTGGNGTVFKLTPSSRGTWTKTILHTFTGGNDGAFPFAPVLIDSSGNLFGTAGGGGTLGWGLVFRIAP
jgi:uncharacterized repeat protein (TIGR03803 family)